VVSVALAEWRGSRSARIDELFDAHRAIGGMSAGRRRGTEQINWALTLRVAAEFQGFARDLHDEAVDFFGVHVGSSNLALSGVLTTLLSSDRGLDKGNAHPQNLAKDFGRMGLQLWTELKGVSARAGQWERTLMAMNKARNAIAHHDVQKLDELERDGWKLSRLETTRRFQRASGSTAAAMDTVVGSHLERIFGRGKPW
jgi:hypothetical protein